MDPIEPRRALPPEPPFWREWWPAIAGFAALFLVVSGGLILGVAQDASRPIAGSVRPQWPQSKPLDTFTPSPTPTPTPRTPSPSVTPRTSPTRTPSVSPTVTVTTPRPTAATIVRTPSRTPTKAPTTPTPTRATDVRSQIHALTNAERVKHGLAPLKRDACLDGTAQAWSNRMATEGRMFHSELAFMDGCDANSVGENVAYGYTSAAETVQAWMDSAGHRKNILDPRFTRLGIGWDGTYGTQHFAS